MKGNGCGHFSLNEYGMGRGGLENSPEIHKMIVLVIYIFWKEIIPIIAMISFAYDVII